MPRKLTAAERREATSLIEEDGMWTCARCGKDLKAGRNAVWLEMATATGEFQAPGTSLPVEQSQGCFPFGAACARNVLVAALAA